MLRVEGRNRLANILYYFVIRPQSCLFIYANQSQCEVKIASIIKNRRFMGVANINIVLFFSVLVCVLR